MMLSRNVADMLILTRAAHRVKPSFEVFCSSLSGAESVDGFRSHGVKDAFVLQPVMRDSGVFRNCQRRMPSCSRRCHGAMGWGGTVWHGRHRSDFTHCFRADSFHLTMVLACTRQNIVTLGLTWASQVLRSQRRSQNSNDRGESSHGRLPPGLVVLLPKMKTSRFSSLYFRRAPLEPSEVEMLFF